MRRVAAVLGLCLLIASCGDDETAVTTDTAAPADVAGDLTAEEREWCSFLGATEADAQRFDQIFQIGLGMGLNMDSVNATAAANRTLYQEQGMTESEAVRAVSSDLFEMEAFVLACRAAYLEFAS